MKVQKMIRFVTAYGSYNGGERAMFVQDKAEMMVRIGAAEFVPEPPKVDLTPVAEAEPVAAGDDTPKAETPKKRGRRKLITK